MLLYVNACVRERSRTKELAYYLVEKLGYEVKKIDLDKCDLRPINAEILAKRFDCIKKRDFDDKMFDYAKDFAAAELIVIAAPYWDLSFPALLKMYIENVNVSKIVFDYSDEGKPLYLCKAKKLFYVSTEGGYGSNDFGFGYIKALCEQLYGIKDVVLIKAEGLDIRGNDVKKILDEAKSKIDSML